MRRARNRVVERPQDAERSATLLGGCGSGTARPQCAGADRSEANGCRISVGIRKRQNGLETLMSRGLGRIQRAIVAVFEAEPDNGFLLSELCERVYRLNVDPVVDLRIDRIRRVEEQTGTPDSQTDPS